MSTTLEHKYGIIGIFNERKAGKTSLAIKELYSKVHSGEYEVGYCNLHSGPQVDSNGVHFGDPKIKFIDFRGLCELKLPSPNGVPTGLVMIDQIHKYLDSRTPNAKRNLKMAEIIIESRQHGFDLIYTTWMRSIVDKRLRPWTDLLVFANQTLRGFEYRRVERKTGQELKPLLMRWGQARDVWRYFDSAELIEDRTIPE